MKSNLVPGFPLCGMKSCAFYHSRTMSRNVSRKLGTLYLTQLLVKTAISCLFLTSKRSFVNLNCVNEGLFFVYSRTRYLELWRKTKQNFSEILINGGFRRGVYPSSNFRGSTVLSYTAWNVNRLDYAISFSKSQIFTHWKLKYSV